MKRTICVLFFALLTAGQEPATVLPGDGTVDGSHFQPYTNAWNMYLVSAQGQRSKNGYWTDQLTHEVWNGQPALRRVQKVESSMGNFVMINVAGRKSMRPFYFESGYVGEVRFEEGAVETTSPSGSKRRQELTQPAFDWSLYGLLLAAFPLEDGYSARFPYFGGTLPTGGGELWMEFRVEGRETVPAGPLGVVEAWKVVTKDGWIFHLTSKAPYVIRLEMPQGGATQVWEMTTPGA